MILLLDNRDSFVHNLARYFRELGEETKVCRSAEISLAELQTISPTHLVISPGPCTPKEAGVSTEAVRHFADRIPVLGVCLGHLCIAEVFGGSVQRARIPRHGKASPILHTGAGIFQGLPNPFLGARYHSLDVAGDSLPPTLELTAWTPANEVMAIRHRDLPVWGVQFHPESILTESGYEVLGNFLEMEPVAAPTEA